MAGGKVSWLPISIKEMGFIMKFPHSDRKNDPQVFGDVPSRPGYYPI
jgi:hypothetical protein